MTGDDGLDLGAYLDRVGAAAEPPGLAAVTALLRAHVRTFGFDNIDVLLEQHPGVTLAAVQEKFVGRGRGGYCFEHATLFHAVVRALGYDAERRLARVGDADAPRTHLGVVVTLDGARYLLDPGIGVPPLDPIPLVDGIEVNGGLWPHRLRRVDDGEVTAWQLWRRRSAGWELMHQLDEMPVRDADVALGHWWTSTSPTTHFRSSLIVGKHGIADDGTAVQTSVSLEGVTERRAGSPSRHRPLDPAELPELLDRLGLHLRPDEARRLLELLPTLGG